MPKKRDDDKRDKPDKNDKGIVQGTGDQRSGGKAVPRTKRSGKEYERQLGKLHVELGKRQDWVTPKGLKVCIVVAERDGAGKGGTIEVIIERVSPRAFRLIAFPVPTEREKSQVYAQRYLPHLQAAGKAAQTQDRSLQGNRSSVQIGARPLLVALCARSPQPRPDPRKQTA
ncbi:hypothetical protein ACKVEX_09080 [Rhodocyclaceae bacterium SMB388]